MWTARCTHEASLWDHNSFITLTYDPENLPPLGSLVFEHFQKFMKRLRKAVPGVQFDPCGQYRPIRFFGCGEYGEKSARPHYHAILFNCRFDDARQHDRKLKTSATLQAAWPFGFSSIGTVTPRSINYVTHYASKKMYGPILDKFLDVVDEETGEVLGRREPEFAQMSRNPGIGHWWYEKYKDQLANQGHIVLNGKEQAVPRAYQKKLAVDRPQAYQDLKARLREYSDSMDPTRLMCNEVAGMAADMRRKERTL